MKRQLKKVSLILLAIAFAVGVLGLAGTLSANDSGKARKIVVFEDDVSETAKMGLLKHFNAEDLGKLGLINGRVVNLPTKAINALTKRTEVKRIDDDSVVFALARPDNPGKKPKKEEPQPEQTIPWGVIRIDANEVWGSNTGQGIKVAIIDSGIDEDHLDLAGNIKGGINTINPNKKWDDDYGHGTHVAGTVAALNNEIGVVGVAPDAHLYAVKVLNRRGIGFLSDVIKGLQWSIDNGMQVANMSLGTSDHNKSYHDAIIAAYNAGITIVAAAGNDGETDGKIYYPAKYLETIAVSATNSNNELAYFSSYGPEINLAAPGQGINSTWKGGYYHIGSGTSMAVPHVVGVAALILADSDLKCDTDNDGDCSPFEVQKRLEETAEWLDLSDNEQNKQGAGLVDAEAATPPTP